MKPHSKERCTGKATDTWVERTNLFREWQGMKKEIMTHKWYESEKAGHDIGWDRALVDWMIRHSPVGVKKHYTK